MPHSQNGQPAISKPVNLFRRGQLLEIIPPVEGLISEFLSVEHVGCASKKKGFYLKQQPLSLVWTNKDHFGNKGLETFAGLEPQIRAYLDTVNQPYVLSGERPKPLSSDTLNEIRGSKPSDRLLLQFVETHERGIVWYRDPNVDIAWIIVQIALAHPEERILVLVTRNHDAYLLYRRIRRVFKKVSLVKTGHDPEHVKRIVVTTRSGMKKRITKIDEQTLFICVNPTEILIPERKSSLKSWRKTFDPDDALDLYRLSQRSGGNPWLPYLNGRFYGLLRSDVLIAPQEKDLLNAVFGPHGLLLQKHGCRDRTVHVVTWKYRGRQVSDHNGSTLDMKRRLIWRDRLRNRLIAKIAKAIAASDHHTLASSFESPVPKLFEKLGERVVILTENVEHAAQLHDRLSDWPIVAGKEVETSGLNPKVKAAIEAGRNPGAKLMQDVLVTPDGFADLGPVGVLIRADAGIGLPPVPPGFYVVDDEIPSTTTIVDDEVPSTVTIVDVKDLHHPYLRRLSKSRKVAYQRRCWSVDGEQRAKNVDFAYSEPSSLHPGRVRPRSISYLSPQKHDPKTTSGKDAYLQRWRKRQLKQKLAKRCIALKTIADPEFLLLSFKELRKEGGLGAGMDNVSFASLSPSEWANAFRKLSKALLRSSYRPLEARRVQIPKPDSDEKRTLFIRSICDRVVAKTLHTALEPHLDKLFLHGSWGFRPRRGTLQMLAQLKKTIEDTDRKVIVIDDIRKAFDNVQARDLIAAHQIARKELKNVSKKPVTIRKSVLRLITVMAKDTDQKRTIGIDQGNNYSPTALNVLLHYVHDFPMTSVNHFPFWFRYVDNLAYLCQDVSEGHEIRQQVQHLLRKSKLELKGKGGGIFDLEQTSANLLGFELHVENNEVHFSLTETAWDSLKLQLSEAHNLISPAETAKDVVAGWVNAFAMAFEKDGSTIAEVLNVAAQHGFREIDRKRVEKTASKAHARWEKMIGQ